ncbi:hypothetical protein [Soonwooa sp.]|uniref:hypothetical protein n=1 Tax=Soonwooa sp. TaxID=1938592 RepID=UPI002630D81F|nr:hypothetical protein [Soonwooa sp.]
MKCNGWASSVKKYEYLFKIRNTGSKNVHFSTKGELSTGERFFSGRYDIKAGAIYFNGMEGGFSNSPPSQIRNFTYTVYRYIENQKDDWGIPSYTCEGGQRVCDKNCNNNLSSNSSNPKGNNHNNSSNKTDSGLSAVEEYDKYWRLKEEICQKIPDLDKKAKYVLRSDYPCNTRTTVTDNEKKVFAVDDLKRDYKKLEDILEDLQNSSNKDNEENQRLEKEKQEKYTSEIQQGDSAMQSGDYTNAMTHYQNAQNNATTDEERANAQQKYQQAVEAKKTAERKVRVEEQKRRDDDAKLAYAGMTAAAVSGMSILEDKASPGFTSGKIYMGLNMEQIPLVSNNINSYHSNKSYIESPKTFGFDLGFVFGIANNKIVSAYLSPKYSLGISITPGTTATITEYGGTVLLRGSWDVDSLLKFYAEGGYFKRNGNIHYDADAEASSQGGTSSTDDVREGEYNYSVLRYGGGIMLHRVDDDDEFMVKAGVFFDKPSFYPKDLKPNLGFTLVGMQNSIGSIEIYYSPKYFVGGNVLFPSSLEKTDVSYFGIKITRTGRLW